MALYAIADLHLSFAVHKPMDRFGPHWVNHPAKIARAWTAHVAATDTVLVCGDTSWAMRLEDAAPDLAWLGALPGRKIVLRGNHDYWWGSLAKARRAVPPGIELLQNDVVQAEGWHVAGARGWTLPVPEASSADLAIYERELGRLRLSLARLPPDGPRLVMLHYPPWMPGCETTPVVEALHTHAVRIAVYGHLHAMPPGTYPDGDRDGIRYHCVSADLVDFTPRRIL